MNLATERWPLAAARRLHSREAREPHAAVNGLLTRLWQPISEPGHRIYAGFLIVACASCTSERSHELTKTTATLTVCRWPSFKLTATGV